jgi:hypothetical protein
MEQFLIKLCLSPPESLRNDSGPGAVPRKERTVPNIQRTVCVWVEREGELVLERDQCSSVSVCQKETSARFAYPL